MNKMVIFLGIVILLAIGGVVVLNKSTSSPSPITADLNVNNSPTVVPLSPTSAEKASASAQATNTPVLGDNTSTNDANLKATSAVIHTAKGDIDLQLYPDVAPKTVANFVKKAQSGFYNNLTFHRVEDWVIQGGDPLGNGTGGGQMPTELNDKPFVTGSLGVARGQDINISNDSQFFITKTDASWLNKQYTNFGIVTKGMNVVNNIQIGDKILGITTQ